MHALKSKTKGFKPKGDLMKLGGSLGNVPQKILGLISLGYCENVPSSTITNIPFSYLKVNYYEITLENKRGNPTIPSMLVMQAEWLKLKELLKFTPF
jgi:hypothetical protein